MNIEPLGDRVLIQIDEPEAASNLIIMPDDNEKEANSATVLAIGKDVEFLSKGDKIVFEKWSLITFKYEKKECYFVKENGVIGIVKK